MKTNYYCQPTLHCNSKFCFIYKLCNMPFITNDYGFRTGSPGKIVDIKCKDKRSHKNFLPNYSRSQIKTARDSTLELLSSSIKLLNTYFDFRLYLPGSLSDTKHLLQSFSQTKATFFSMSASILQWVLAEADKVVVLNRLVCGRRYFLR
jgi:hypothetical protein